MKSCKIICSISWLILLALACEKDNPTEQPGRSVPHGERWGIYSLDLNTEDVQLIYSSPDEITNLRLNPAADRFVFSRKVGGNSMEDSEIFTMGISGNNLQRLTNNQFLDTYPAWSPDGSRIAYLAWAGETLDIFMMAADGSQSSLFYDSGYHDADINWVDTLIVFTRNSQIWLINSEGSHVRQLTDPPRAGEWGNANLPFGDYDPRISPDGSKVVFERLVDDSSPHGNYDLFTININGTNLKRITDTGYSQGLASWAPSGTKLVFIVAAIDDVGQYDIYSINPDGTENRNITPDFFPPEFLIHWVSFSENDNLLYFIGEWWSE